MQDLATSIWRLSSLAPVRIGINPRLTRAALSQSHLKPVTINSRNFYAAEKGSRRSTRAVAHSSNNILSDPCNAQKGMKIQKLTLEVCSNWTATISSVKKIKNFLFCQRSGLDSLNFSQLQISSKASKGHRRGTFLAIRLSRSNKTGTIPWKRKILTVLGELRKNWVLN